MPLDDEISALSKSDLRERLNECREARAAQRLAQREAMTAGAAATDNDVSSYAAKIHESETAVQEFDEEMASLGMAMRQRASPAKTRPPASNLRPTIKSKTADQTELFFGTAQASTARAAPARLPTDSPITEDEEMELARPAVRGPPAPNVLESAQAEASPASVAAAQANVDLDLFLANSPIKGTDRKTFVEHEISRTAPRSPLGLRVRGGPVVKRKVKRSSSAPGDSPLRSASPNFRKAMTTMNAMSRSVNTRASIAPGGAPAGGV
jgi:hypothetical protein